MPDFGGGHFISLVAAFTVGSLLWVILKENVWALTRPARAPAQAHSDEADARAPGLKERWLAIIYTVLMFALVYLLGTVAGCVLFVGAFLLRYKRGSLWVAIFLGLVVGGVLPYLLSGILGVRLWEGVIPAIIPGWIGGGVPPPL